MNSLINRALWDTKRKGFSLSLHFGSFFALFFTAWRRCSSRCRTPVVKRIESVGGVTLRRVAASAMRAIANRRALRPVSNRCERVAAPTPDGSLAEVAVRIDRQRVPPTRAGRKDVVQQRPHPAWLQARDHLHRCQMADGGRSAFANAELNRRASSSRNVRLHGRKATEQTPWAMRRFGGSRDR